MSEKTSSDGRPTALPSRTISTRRSISDSYSELSSNFSGSSRLRIRSCARLARSSAGNAITSLRTSCNVVICIKYLDSIILSNYHHDGVNTEFGFIIGSLIFRSHSAPLYDVRAQNVTPETVFSGQKDQKIRFQAGFDCFRPFPGGGKASKRHFGAHFWLL